MTETLKRRGVRAIVYFHTDHFEPWRLTDDGDPAAERCARAVEGYVGQSAQLDFARRASLFCGLDLNAAVSADRELHRCHPSDLLGFAPRTAKQLAAGRRIMEPIVSARRDLQVYLRHRAFTYTETADGTETMAYLQTRSGRAFDNARLELAIQLTLDRLREDGGPALANWFFIHGAGALNASDPHECTVLREIEILRRNGCLGDFTQPAAQLHADSRIETPHLVDPVAAAKGYDLAQANPSPAAGAGTAGRDRFFLWASAATYWSASIDTGSPFVRERIKTPRATALERARSSVVIDGVLYLKTHAHSLHPAYWRRQGRGFPHADPAVQAELRALFQPADAVGIGVEFLTAAQVYDRILAAPSPPMTDLKTEFDLVGSPMAPLGLTVDFFDATWRRADDARAAGAPAGGDSRPLARRTARRPRLGRIAGPGGSRRAYPASDARGDTRRFRGHFACRPLGR